MVVAKEEEGELNIADQLELCLGALRSALVKQFFLLDPHPHGLCGPALQIMVYKVTLFTCETTVDHEERRFVVMTVT